MNTSNNKHIKQTYLELILICLSCFASIKHILVDYGIDAAYELSMAYRMVQGDRMFIDMWEPNQTSAFLGYLLLKPFLFIAKTPVASVVYLQICGTLISVAVTLYAYCALKRYEFNRIGLAIFAFTLFNILPKDIVFPEYSNMQIWFSICIFSSLLFYFASQKSYHIFLTAIFTLLAIMSYPSIIIIYFPIAVFIYLWGNRKDIIYYTLECLLLGFIYLAVMFRGTRKDELIFIYKAIRGLEATHSNSSYKILGISYVKDISLWIVLTFVLVLLAFIVSIIIEKAKKNMSQSRFELFPSCLLCLCNILVIYLGFFRAMKMRYDYSFLFIPIIVLAFKMADKPNQKHGIPFYLGTSISFANFLATLVLTDLTAISVIPYLKLGFAVSLLIILDKSDNAPGSPYIRHKVLVQTLLLISLLFIRNIYVIRPINGQVATAFDIRGIVKDGPAKGLISEYMSAYIQNETLKEYKEYVPEESNIYICGNEIDTTGYLYNNTQIAAPTVMCTPTYNDYLSYYWETHPSKYPDVVIVSCWYGNIDGALEKGQWLDNWLENDFQYKYYIDGKYWRYYYRQ